jgi:hypothetical protein
MGNTKGFHNILDSGSRNDLSLNPSLLSERGMEQGPQGPLKEESNLDAPANAFLSGLQLLM